MFTTCGMPGKLHFDRNGNIAFDLFGRRTVALRNDFDLRRHWIRVRFDIQRSKREETGNQRNREKDDSSSRLMPQMQKSSNRFILIAALRRAVDEHRPARHHAIARP